MAPVRGPARGLVGQLLLVGLLLGLGWFYFFVLRANAVDRAIVRVGIPMGVYRSDMYAPWLGTRAVFREGGDPYGAAVTADIQRGFFGRLITAADKGQYPETFVYPLYSVFVFAGFAWLPFAVVQFAFRWLAIPLVALTTIWWITGLGWALDRRQRILLALVSTATISAFDIVDLQQPTLLVGLCLAAAAACLARGTQAPLARQRTRFYLAAGVLLALSTVKPQLSFAVIGWLAIWTFFGWPARRPLFFGLVGTMAALLAGAFLVRPSWVQDWLAALAAYQDYATGSPILWILLPAPWLFWAGVGGAAALTGFCWRVRHAAPGSLEFNLALVGCLLYAVFVLPRYSAYNQVVLFPALLLVLQQGRAIQARGRAWQRLYPVLLGLLAWSWIAEALLIAAWAGAQLSGNPAGALAAADLWVWPWLAGYITPITLLIPVGICAWQILHRPPAQYRPLPEIAPP